MVKNYYIIFEGQQFGPLSAQQILSKNLSGSFKVWNKDMAHWLEFNSSEEFKQFLLAGDAPASEETPVSDTRTPDTRVFHKKIEDNNLDLSIAPIQKRLFAHIVNAVVYWVLVVIIVSIVDDENWSLIAFLLPKLLYLYTYPKFSGNIGHMVLGLKVVNKTTREDFSKPLLGMVRELIKHFIGFLIIPIVFLFFNEDNQNLYDLILNTLVVEKEQDKAFDIKREIKEHAVSRKQETELTKPVTKEQSRYRKS